MKFAFTGLKRSGKDSAADEFAETWGVEKVLFAGTLKAMIRTLLESAGLDEDAILYYMEGAGKEEPLAALQGKSCRFAMQKLGTEWRNFFGKDLWTDILSLKLDALDAEHADVAITDMRFLHEAAFVEARGGIKIRVLRAGQPKGVDLHPSETEMEEIEVDYTLFNHGSLEDYQTAVAILAYSLFNNCDLAEVAKDWTI